MNSGQQQVQQPPQQQPLQGPQLHHFEVGTYNEVVKILSEFSGFVIGELQKPEPMTHIKIAQMLQLYVEHCLRKGPVAGEETVAPTGTTCRHHFIKGLREGQDCGKPAKCMGVDNLPKCATHKKSKPAKIGLTGAEAAEPGAAGQTFSYAANASKGKTAPQNLTSIQAAIAEQTEPATLNLLQAPDGRTYHQDSGIVFEQRNGNWTAIGVMDGEVTRKLTVMDTYVCFGNMWKWDPSCIDDEGAKNQGHSFIVEGEHSLITSSDGIIQKKIDSVFSNSK